MRATSAWGLRAARTRDVRLQGRQARSGQGQPPAEPAGVRSPSAPIVQPWITPASASSAYRYCPSAVIASSRRPFLLFSSKRRPDRAVRSRRRLRCCSSRSCCRRSWSRTRTDSLRPVTRLCSQAAAGAVTHDQHIVVRRANEFRAEGTAESRPEALAHSRSVSLCMSVSTRFTIREPMAPSTAGP